MAALLISACATAQPELQKRKPVNAATTKDIRTLEQILREETADFANGGGVWEMCCRR